MEREDPFESFLKAKLEEDAVVSPACAAAIRRAAEVRAMAGARVRGMRSVSVRPWRAWVAAAVAAVACAVAWKLAVRPSVAAPSASVAQVVEFLRGVDGLADDAGGEAGVSVAEILLAWQDAPFSRLADGLGAVSGVVAEGSF